MTSSLPQRCAHRPLAGGLVVPWVSLVHNGHAAFGSINTKRAIQAFLSRLCQICGQALDERCFLIVRPADMKAGYAPEPALHPECLPYAAAQCPMLNGVATRYRQHPILEKHPAGRPCADPACPCPGRSPGQDHSARSGRPADRYEAWMISSQEYRLAARADAPEIPAGISLAVPILRRRLLREAALPADAARLLELLHSALDLDAE